MTDIPPNPHADRIMRLPDVIARIGLSRASIYLQMAKGSFPKSVPLGSRARGWYESDVTTWVMTRAQLRDAER